MNRTMIRIAAILLLAITVTLTGCQTFGLKLKKIPPGQAKKMALEL